MTAFPRVIVLAATHGLMVVSGAAPFEPNAPSTAVAGDRHVDGMTLLVPSQLGVTRATVGYVLIGLLVVGWVVVIGVHVRRHRAPARRPSLAHDGDRAEGVASRARPGSGNASDPGPRVVLGPGSHDRTGLLGRTVVDGPTPLGRECVGRCQGRPSQLRPACCDEGCVARGQLDHSDVIGGAYPSPVSSIGRGLSGRRRAISASAASAAS